MSDHYDRLMAQEMAAHYGRTPGWVKTLVKQAECKHEWIGAAEDGSLHCRKCGKAPA